MVEVTSAFPLARIKILHSLGGTSSASPHVFPDARGSGQQIGLD